MQYLISQSSCFVRGGLCLRCLNDEVLLCSSALNKALEASSKSVRDSPHKPSVSLSDMHSYRTTLTRPATASSKQSNYFISQTCASYGTISSFFFFVPPAFVVFLPLHPLLLPNPRLLVGETLFDVWPGCLALAGC